MDSRKQKEKDVDDAIKSVSTIFRVRKYALPDDECAGVIKLLSPSKLIPDYKRDEVTFMLMHAYYLHVKGSIQNERIDSALESANAFLKLGSLDQDSENYKYYERYKKEIDKLLPELIEKREQIKIEKAEKEEQIKIEKAEKEEKKKYYYVVMHNWKTNPDMARDAGKQYLKLFKSPPENDPSYNKVQDVMLAIHSRRVAQMKAAEQRKKEVDNIPAVKAYRSLETPFFPAPRTPNSTKMMNSLTHKKSSVHKSKRGASKSLHLSASGTSSVSQRKKK